MKLEDVEVQQLLCVEHSAAQAAGEAVPGVAQLSMIIIMNHGDISHLVIVELLLGDLGQLPVAAGAEPHHQHLRHGPGHLDRRIFGSP